MMAKSSGLTLKPMVTPHGSGALHQETRSPKQQHIHVVHPNPHLKAQRDISSQLCIAGKLYHSAVSEMEHVQEIEKMEDSRSLWTASKEGSTSKIYFYGSLHKTDIERFPVPKAVENLVKQSDFLAREYVIDPQHKQKYMQVLKDRKINISEYLTPENKIIYQACCKVLGMTDQTDWWTAGLFYFKDFLYDRLLSLAGWKVTSMEEHFISTLAGANTEVVGLEPANEHLEHIENLSLQQESSNLEQKRQGWNILVSHIPKYMDVPSYVALRHKNDASSEWHDAVIASRNRAMSKNLETLLTKKPGASVFVLVGARHLIHDYGMQSLMRYKGWHIEKTSPGQL